LSNLIRIDDERIQDHLGKIVRGSVEETLNALLDAEADRLCKAERYERTKARQDTRAGSYERKLQTRAGKVKLKVPKLRQQTFETAIIERYRRRECSVEEALVEMYLAGVSVRWVEDITEALWGTRVSPGTVSNPKWQSGSRSIETSALGQVRPRNADLGRRGGSGLSQDLTSSQPYMETHSSQPSNLMYELGSWMSSSISSDWRCVLVLAKTCFKYCRALFRVIPISSAARARSPCTLRKVTAILASAGVRP
jgi:hypothetical protein